MNHPFYQLAERLERAGFRQNATRRRIRPDGEIINVNYQTTDLAWPTIEEIAAEIRYRWPDMLALAEIIIATESELEEEFYPEYFIELTQLNKL